jgi:RimJ/RimL family protein N-acetyltransferase
VIPLDTERLTIRELTEEDAPFMLRLLNEPSYIRFIGDRGVRTVEEARAFLRDRLIAHYRRHGFGLFLVELREPRASVGICGLIRRDGLDDVDVGFAFLPEHWSKGYALESARAVMSFGEGVLGLARIVAIVTPENGPSIRLLEKLGLRFERMIDWPADGSRLALYGTVPRSTTG